MTEIYVNHMYVTPCEDAAEVFKITGKSWEGDPFHLYVNESEAKSLISQLGFYVYEQKG